MIKSIKSLAATILVSLFAATSLFSAECIAPANPGGGWDFTCRSITKIMYDIGAVESPIQVTNMAGGGGGLGPGGGSAGRAEGGGGGGDGGMGGSGGIPQPMIRPSVTPWSSQCA